MKTMLKCLLFAPLCLLAHVHVLAGPVTTDFTKGPQSIVILPGTGAIPTSGIFDADEQYVHPVAGRGRTTLKPVAPTDQLNPSVNFLAVLGAAFTVAVGWTFGNSPAELSNNSLSVRTYDAVGTAAQVGADFHLKYVPGAGDPTAATHDIHWIQLLKNNHKLGAAHGTPDNKVDIPGGQGDPFYDARLVGGVPTGFAANATDFIDKPRRLDSDKAHMFDPRSTPKTGHRSTPQIRP